MSPVRMLQAAGSVMLVAAFICPRIPAVRPHARRIMMVAVGFYALAAIGLVIWRVIAGPGPFME